MFASESKVQSLLSRINILEKDNVDLRSQIIGWKKAVCQQEEESLEKDKQIMRQEFQIKEALQQQSSGGILGGLRRSRLENNNTSSVAFEKAVRDVIQMHESSYQNIRELYQNSPVMADNLLLTQYEHVISILISAIPEECVICSCQLNQTDKQ